MNILKPAEITKTKKKKKTCYIPDKIRPTQIIKRLVQLFSFYMFIVLVLLDSVYLQFIEIDTTTNTCLIFVTCSNCFSCQTLPNCLMVKIDNSKINRLRPKGIVQRQHSLPTQTVGYRHSLPRSTITTSNKQIAFTSLNVPDITLNS